METEADDFGIAQSTRDYWANFSRNQALASKFAGSLGMARLHPPEPEWSTAPVRKTMAFASPELKVKIEKITRPPPPPVQEKEPEPDVVSEDEIARALDVLKRANIRIQQHYDACDNDCAPVDEIIEYELPKKLMISEIVAEVARFYNLHPREVISHRRNRSIARPRQEAMLLSRALTDKSLPIIGKVFNRDHTTVIHACGLIAEMFGICTVKEMNWLKIAEWAEARFAYIVESNLAARVCAHSGDGVTA